MIDRFQTPLSDSLAPLHRGGGENSEGRAGRMGLHSSPIQLNLIRF